MIVERIDLPSFLEAQPLLPKFYFRCPETGEERAALGSLLTVTELPSDLPDSCFYGALTFSSDSPGFFFLPRVEIRQTPEQTHLTFHAPTPLLSPLPSSPSSCHLKRLKDTPDRETWLQNLTTLIAALRSRQLQKAVAARKTTFRLTGSPFPMLDRLSRCNPLTRTFALQTTPSSLFLGSSPERLYARRGRQFFSEAIAGTRKRGLTPEEDDEWGRELLASHKDLEEFSFVREFLEQELSFVVERFVKAKGTGLIKTQHVQHLHHIFEGTLKEGMQDIDLLKRLHPTPAVGGLPRMEALEWISRLEPFSRGFYAGPIGWASKEESLFVVAIRSALIEDGLLHAYTGAGIVQDSDPAKEWEELEAKLTLWSHACTI